MTENNRARTGRLSAETIEPPAPPTVETIYTHGVRGSVGIRALPTNSNKISLTFVASLRLSTT